MCLPAQQHLPEDDVDMILDAPQDEEDMDIDPEVLAMLEDMGIIEGEEDNMDEDDEEDELRIARERVILSFIMMFCIGDTRSCFRETVRSNEHAECQEVHSSKLALPVTAAGQV
ncbi:hypothetical protein MTO96_022607 [Rhipicephalus appendiculatus]